MTLRRLSPWKLGLLAQSRTNPSIFGDWYEATCEAVLAYFVRETENEQVAFDLLGETYANAFQHRCDFKGSTDKQGAAWLWKIVEHSLIDYRRAKGVEFAALRKVGWERQVLTENDMHEFERAAVACEISAELRAALIRLPHDQQRVIDLRYTKDLNYEQIARELGVSSIVARKRGSRALGALRVSHHLQEIRLLRRP